MLALFKGELAFHEFYREMTYKQMMAIRGARVQQLIDERERIKKEEENMKRQDIRNNILRK